MSSRSTHLSRVVVLALLAASSYSARADYGCDGYSEPQEHAACDRGRSEGVRMGREIGGRAGRAEGFLSGYAQGIVNGVNQGQSDSAYYAQGQSMESSVDSQMTSAVQAAHDQGVAAGQSQGSSDAIGRFQAALNTGQAPSPGFSVPANSYSPNGDAFETLVGAMLSPAQVIQSRFPQPVSFDWDAQYGDLHDPTPAELYQAGTGYDVGHDIWVNDDNGFNHWHQQSGGCDSFSENYIPSTDGNGGGYGHGHGQMSAAGPGPASGGPAPQHTGKPSATPAPVAPAPVIAPPKPPVAPAPVAPAPAPTAPIVIVQPAPQPVNLRQICEDGFRKSYRESADQAFNQGVSMTQGTGMASGLAVGLTSGQALSQQRGEADAFNQRFITVSSQSNRSGFSEGYSSGFQSTFQDYMTHPKLSISFNSMVNEDEGILEPGLPFSATFTLTNIGGVPAQNLTVTAGGADVVNARTQTVSIDALKSQQMTAHNIATLSGGIANHQQADVQLVVGDQSSTLESQVQHILAVSAPSAQVDYLNGIGSVTAVISNVAKTKAYGGATAVLYVNNQVVDTKNIGILDTQATQTVTFSMTGQDPLALLQGGNNAVVVVTINSIEMDRNSVSLDPTADVKERMMVTYFDQVANGQGVVPASVDRNARLNDVRAALSQINESEVQSHRNLSDENLWGEADKTTVPTLLATKFQAGPESSDAKKQYDQLAHEFWTHCGEFQKNGNLFGDKRSDKEKSYGDLCHRIASTKL